jgi:hypothetical protein
VVFGRSEGNDGMARKSRPSKKRPANSAKRRSATPKKPDALDAFIAAAAKALDLPTQKMWLPAIKANLRVTLQHANTVGEFKLPDGAEPAPVFKA